MDGSEKEKSSDMRTSPSSPKELDRGGEPSNVSPPLPSPPVSDQVKDDLASNPLPLVSSDTPHWSDREHLSERNLFPTDLARTSPSERSSFPQRTEGVVDNGGPGDMHTANMGTPAWSRDELDRGGGNTHVARALDYSPGSDLPATSIGPPDEVKSGVETTNVVPHFTSPPASDRKNDDPGADCQSSTSDTPKRGGDQLSQRSPSTIDQARTSSLKRSSFRLPGSLSTIDQARASSVPRSLSLLQTTAEAKKIVIQEGTETSGRTSGDEMQAHGPATGDAARYEALVREKLTAIEKKDCKALLRIVDEICEEHWEQIPDMLEVSSTKDPRTILHVAAMQGCFPLAKQVLDIAKEKVAPEAVKSYIERVDPESSMTAFQMVFDITGNRSIAEYIKQVLQFIHDHEDVPVYEAYTLTNRDPEDMSKLSYPFYEAYTRTEWWNYLRKFCGHSPVNFTRELRHNSRLLLETFHGLTVLHLAILLNDISVVKQVLDVFGSKKKVVWGNSYFPSTLTWDQMLMLPGEGWEHNLQKDLTNCVTDSEAHASGVRILLKSISRSTSVLHSDATALELAKKLGYSNIVQALQNYGNNGLEHSHPNNELENEEVTAMLPEFYYNTQSQLLTTIQGVMQAKHDWKREFEEDVDFNFEEEPRLSLLQLHYLCKDPLKFQNSVALPLCYFDFVPNHGILSIFDGQGRSALRILLDSWPIQNQLPGNFKQIFNLGIFDKSLVLDVKGRQAKHVFFLNHYGLDKESNVLRVWRDIPYTMLLKRFQVALSMKHSNLAISIWLALKKRFKNDGVKQTTLCHPLLIAASYGNQTILRLELDGTTDPLVTDDKKRTALHHAADASLLDPPYTDEEFYSTVEELCRDKRIWKEERGKVFGLNKVNSINGMVIYDDQIELKLAVVERKACILMLIQAGVDLSEADSEGKVPKVGASVNADLQSWWYDMVVKDATDHKNSFNQAGNALSVVGTLVAATSYVGPLQPPMSYVEGGFVHIGEKLVEIFMVTNTLAFYFAMASVMFAVVPSLPMPREGVMSELRRARHTVSLSLCFLLIATSMIIISFAAASIAVIHDEQSYHQTDLLFVPSLIGWSICLFASLGFLLRVLTLIHYKNPIIRKLYQFSLTEFCKKACRSWKFYFTTFDSFHAEWKYFEEILVQGTNYLNSRSKLGAEPGNRFLIFIVFVFRVVVFVFLVLVSTVWLVCWPVLHYVVIFRNFERFEEKDKPDRIAELHGDRKRRSLIF